MDMGRIHNHKEVNFMKKFNLSKGLLVGLLTLALCFTCFGYVKASAAAETKTITFKAAGSEATYEVTYSAYQAAVAAQGEEGQPGYVAGSDAVPASIADATKLSLATILEKLGKEDDCLYVKGTGDPTFSVDGVVSLAGDKFTLADTAAKDVTVTIPVKSPKVTFTVTVKDMFHKADEEGYEGGDYTFVAGAEQGFQKANKTLPLATILAEMKKSDKNLEDSTAWIIAAKFNATAYIDAFDLTSKNFKILKNLTEDVAIAITVTNSKVPITITSGAYKAVFYVTNKDYSTTSADILFSDIVANLKKIEDGNEVGFEGEKVILDSVTAFGSDKKTDGKYDTWKYMYKQTGIAQTAPAAKDIAAASIVDAFINDEEHGIITGYHPASDSIVFVSPVNVTIRWADVKKAAGASLTSAAFKSLDTKLDTAVGSSTNGKYVASISLHDKSAGVNNAVTKGTYIYASIVAPAEGKTKVKYSANYVVDPTPYKKVTVNVDYAGAKKTEDATPLGAVTRFTTTNTSGKSTTYVRGTDPATDEDAPEDFEDVWESLQYSIDGTSWRWITGNDLVKGKSVDFTTGMLYNLVTGSKTTLYFRLCGAYAVEADEEHDIAAKNAYRASKPVKVGIAASKAGKAVKVDVTKNAIALKNGFDFYVGDNDKGYTELGYTILPFNKEGKSLDDEGEPLSIISTASFAPVKKPAENAEMFTKEKIKSVPIEEIVGYFDGKAITAPIIYLYVRTSATVAKPASTWTLVKIAGQTAGPSLTATKGKFAIQDEKGALVIPAAKKAGSDKTSASGFEFLIVDEADAEDDFAGVDFSTAKWSKLVEGKTIVVGKTSSKYGKDGGKATAHVLKDGSKVLIRRVGDKGSNTLASQYTITKVIKDTVQVEVENAEGKKTKEDKDLFVWVAN
jgi:hypothetical protein